MNNTTTPFDQESEDYRRGWRDAWKEAQRLDEQANVMEVIFGAKTEDDLNQREIDMLRRIQGNSYGPK